MKVLLSWIREHVDVPGTAEAIGERMSLRGLALEGIEALGGPTDDAVIDFDVTANRPDCLSIRGIAREIATVYDLPLKELARPEGRARGDDALPQQPRGDVAPRQQARGDHAPPRGGPALAGASTVPVSIPDQDLCSRYIAAVADVTVGPSPAWMQTRLTACGIRPISNVVDVTNYVLLELGYPMHAFDQAKLAGPAIVVRRARPGEKIRTLDGKERQLEPEMLVIADADRAQAIGGVMGGSDSEVNDATSRIVFEAAWFNPKSVRATSKRLGLRTEASYRFERGADLTGTARAMARALQLLEAIGAGQAAGPIVDCYPVPYTEREMTLNGAVIRRFLGMDVPETDALRILGSLGFSVRTLGGWQAGAPEAATPMSQPGHAWQVGVPGWRVDVHRPVDVVEEIGRHYGFEHLPSTFPAVEQAPPPSDRRIARDARVRDALIAMGLSEAVTFAFIERDAAAPYLMNDAPVLLANPLSEKFTTLRPSLLPGLLDVVSHNRRHGRRDVRLFEIGTRFAPHGETRAAACAWTGVATPAHWSAASRDVDFFDIKGVAEHTCATLNVAVEIVTATRPYLVPGRTAELRVDGVALGVLGQIDPALAEQRDLPGADAVYVLEIDLEALSARAPQGTRFATPLPRHPAVIRDIAILLDDTLSAEAVRGTIRSAGPDTLIDVREFDRYDGKGIAEGKVSLAVRLTFQAPDRTLTDTEVHAAMERIVADLTTKLGATQR
jgi:phenylalanyl-tRNA synthetase beta chain